MIKILQFGEGNFLRAFADAYFQSIFDEGLELEVHIVLPIPASIDRFAEQNNRYHVILRGSADGQDVEEVVPIRVIRRVIDPFSDPDSYDTLARDPELKLIVSNTTEAGICYKNGDRFDGFADITYPAKLTKFLYTRFRAGLPGVYLLPVELIDDNADRLFECVEKYIDLWSLPEAFRTWNQSRNFYCNTLVDRIVSGYPRDEKTRAHLTELLGKPDGLMTVGEPFGLWAIEKKRALADLLPQGRHNIDVVLTNDIGYYKKRKVRVLNGSHTNLVPAGLWLGKQTVFDCIKDPALSRLLLDTLREEIVPFVSDDTAATQRFADSVLDRFGNPYLNHQLTSIALNSISKWKTRLLPSFKDYYARYGKIPKNITVGFSYLLQLYRSVTLRDGRYFVRLPSREIELVDEVSYLNYFANGGSVRAFMEDPRVWGEDLTAYEGFADTVEAALRRLASGQELI